MKRIISVFLIAVMVFTAFVGCGNDEDLNWIASFEYENGYTWIYKLEKQGVITLKTREDIPEQNGNKGNTMFIFEPVGEGETTVMFSYLSDGGEIIKTVEYKVSVDKDYKYTATQVQKAEGTTVPKNITDEKEAEKILSEFIGAFDKVTGNEFVIDYEKNYDENNKRYYLFYVTTVVNENGKTYLRFYKAYTVNQDGTIEEYTLETEIPDREIELK